MFESASKSMPAIDYVSIVTSVYKDRRAMILGALACAIGAGFCALKTQSLGLTLVALAFIVIGLFRYRDMTAFLEAKIGPTDAEAAQRWEVRATYFASAFAFTCGLWCFYSFVFINDSVAELISMAVTIACMVGVVSRNFGLDRMLSIQLWIAVVMISMGLIWKLDLFHIVLGVLLLPMLISFRFLASDTRHVLLSAVHARVEASRLAVELDTALDTMHHGLLMLDNHGLVTVINGQAEDMLALLAPGPVVGRPFSALISGAAARGTLPQRAASDLMHMIAGLKNGKMVLRFPNERFGEVTVSSREGRVVLLFEDVTERMQAEERINFMAHYDALTGLPNRGYFAQQVQNDLERRKEGFTVDASALMIVDIDDFKHVNDTAGHLVGDRLLVEAADRLKRALGLNNLVARLGGDEFIVYRSGPITEADIHADALAVLEAFSPPFLLLGESLSTTVSIGSVLSTDSHDDLDSLMTKADLALYKAKGNGKGQLQLFVDEMDTAYRYRQRLKAELKTCIDNNGLSLVFQPLVDLKTRRVVGCEALARWSHPTLGSIPPSLFIPIAEETGLISDITRWVLRTAAAECMNWPSTCSVSVNVSARDFRNADVEQMVLEALRQTGLPPHRLEIEVTETALIEERDAATKILGALGRHGIGIALDDFGTGYSSLSYLQAMPFTKLKVDRSFVMDIGSNARSLKLLSNVAQLGKDINLTVTAEGVETEEQLALIQQHTKVDQIQGYLFGIPLPRREVAELIGRMERSAGPGVDRRFDRMVNVG